MRLSIYVACVVCIVCSWHACFALKNVCTIHRFVALLRVPYLCICVCVCLLVCLLCFFYIYVFVYDVFRLAFYMLLFSLMSVVYLASCCVCVCCVFLLFNRVFVVVFECFVCLFVFVA